MKAKMGSSDRAFGLVFAAFFMLIFYVPMRRIGELHWSRLVFSIVFFVLAIFKPSILSPFNKLWLKFGHLLSKLTTPIVMGLLFYGLFTGFRFLLKIFGKEVLSKSFNKKLETYWVKRNEELKKESFKLQF